MTFKRCKHEYEQVARIGGDTQATALKCSLCGKTKTECHGINGRLSFECIIRYVDEVLSSR